MKKILFTTLLYFIIQLSLAQVVVIDAGHGYCSDCTQNCTSNVRSDHEILTAMAVSLKLDSLFSNYCTSVTTYLTRESNDCGDFPTLSQRATMSNNWGADRFLSVHCNAGGGTGTETFWCNNSISSNAECQTFAQEVQDQMVSYGSWNYRRCVEDYTYLNFHLGVLHPTNAVGCLNEIGFVDYTSDLNKLLSNSWRNQFALAYYEALQNDLGITCSPQVLDCSGSVALSCGVSYSGSASSASSNVGTYGCNNWTETGPERVHTITPNTSGTITATISNFTGDLDVYILGSCNAADCLGTVSSSSATYNNAVAGQTYYIVVDADDGSGSAYNLIVNCANEQHDFTLNNAQITSNTNVVAGGNIQVSVSQNYTGNTVNNGISALQYYLSTDCTLDANDILLGSDSSTLDINNTSEIETATLNIPQNTSTGNYNIIFVADAMNAFAEQNENNNTVCVSFQVVPPPTLDCSGAITLTCGSVYHGNASSAPNVISTYGCNNWTETGPERVHTITPSFTGTLTATISNFTGDLDVYILGSCDAADCLGTVSSSSATFNGAVAGQTYYIVVDADDGSGSAYDLIVDCPTPSEDITLSGATVSNNVVDSNTNIMVGVNQVYAGGQNSSALNDVAVSFYLSTNCTYDASDVLLGTEISDLGNNNPSIYESINFSINPSTMPGTYQILIIADSHNDITESNETNNTMCLPITVIYPNDVTLSNPSLNISTVVAGNDVIASANHNYSGSQPSANLANATLGFYLSIDCVFDNSDIALGAVVSNLGSDNNNISESKTLNIPSSTTAGNYYILFIADNYNNIAEINENNNTACLPITVNEPVIPNDLYLNNYSLTPDSVEKGESINISVNHNYSGSETASNLADVNLSFYLSNNCTFESNDVLLNQVIHNLGSNNTSETVNTLLNIPISSSTGFQYVLIISDKNNEIAESNESNNTACLPLKILENNVSIKENWLKENITLFPNPTNGVITVLTSNNLKLSSYQIFDLSGKVVSPTQNFDSKINIAHLSNGIYFIQFTSNNNIKTTIKVVKE